MPKKLMHNVRAYILWFLRCLRFTEIEKPYKLQN